ncbi:MAG TPA: type II toxin-antitoxin system HicB family antitoxin, partial [Tepidisphaeraceae bacterium]|nr:type II toxin-antitoxin system HicB family antitoxin [Tepidisphaeraceae bacterium]
MQSPVINLDVRAGTILRVTYCWQIQVGRPDGRRQSSDVPFDVAQGNRHISLREQTILDASTSGRNDSFMLYRIIIEQDEDGEFVAECPTLPGCTSQGHIRGEAVANIKDAIAGYL